MTFQQAIDFLYSRLPVFQNQGARAYKPGLTTTREFCKYLGEPQTKFKSIHVGGTNGKGSTSHMLASVLQKAGFRVGLYTSPHLKSFTERIRVNGLPVEEPFVSEFVEKHQEYIESISPSFFEVTVAMAFDYFAKQQVDFAIIEVGMGGRLDSTNVIVPLLSIITNISFDHTAYLGDTLPKIAAEKAGIIKHKLPVIISENADQEVLGVFITHASQKESKLYLADDLIQITSTEKLEDRLIVEAVYQANEEKQQWKLDLTGEYQLKNIKGVLVAIRLLQNLHYPITNEHIREGLASVIRTTGLKGRWQTLQTNPRVICDTAHNYAGLKHTLAQLKRLKFQKLRLVLGFVADKDLDSILPLFPKHGVYYFCQPDNSRALPALQLSSKAKDYNLVGETFENVNIALNSAIKDSDKNDVIYVGGSTFVVADLDQL